MPGVSTLHKDLHVLNRIHGEIGANPAAAGTVALPLVTISATVYGYVKLGTLPAGAVLQAPLFQCFIDDAFDDAGAILLVGTCTSDFSPGAVDPTGIIKDSLMSDSDITQATTGYYPGVAASVKTGFPVVPAVDTDVYAFYTDSGADGVIADGHAYIDIVFTHDLNPTTIS